jgi:hypothetical protein
MEQLPNGVLELVFGHLSLENESAGLALVLACVCTRFNKVQARPFGFPKLLTRAGPQGQTALETCCVLGIGATEVPTANIYQGRTFVEGLLQVSFEGG